MKRILVVDDDAAARELVSEILRALDYQVETAPNGIEALDRLRAGRPDVVLLDLRMPVMDGWAFLEECDSRGLCGELPIIVMSGDAEALAATARRFRVLGVSKPVEVVPLLATVQELAGS